MKENTRREGRMMDECFNLNIKLYLPAWEPWGFADPPLVPLVYTVACSPQKGRPLTQPLYHNSRASGSCASWHPIACTATEAIISIAVHLFYSVVLGSKLVSLKGACEYWNKILHSPYKVWNSTSPAYYTVSRMALNSNNYLIIIYYYY